jgi:hypothetical protein
MIELYKMQDKQWVIKRKEKSYPIKNLESVFVYLMAFNLNFKLIEDTVIKMEMNDFNFARFQGGRAILEKR